MLRTAVAAVLVLLLFAGGLLADDIKGTVVSCEKGKLVVQVGDKERTFQLGAKPHVHDADGNEVEPKDVPKHLKKGVKVEIEVKGDKVVEINIKK